MNGTNPTSTAPQIPIPEIEYVKLWMQQSQLFWSRLQLASVLHSGVLVGWYKIKGKHNHDLKSFILFVGIALSFFLLAIMFRDGQYMEAMKSKSGSAFPYTGKSAPMGRGCGYCVVVIFMVAEVLLLMR